MYVEKIKAFRTTEGDVIGYIDSVQPGAEVIEYISVDLSELFKERENEAKAKTSI